MILSPIKCFLIQLTLTFVVFFYNTLAQEKYVNPENWCQPYILSIYHDQFPDVEFENIPDYIYVCIGICINTLQSFTSEGYNKTDDTIQETMEKLKSIMEASKPIVEAIKPVVEAYKLALETYISAIEDVGSAKQVRDDAYDIYENARKQNLFNQKMFLCDDDNKYKPDEARASVQAISMERNNSLNAINNCESAKRKCREIAEDYPKAKEKFLNAIKDVGSDNKTYTSAKTHLSLACTNKYVDEKTKLS